MLWRAMIISNLNGHDSEREMAYDLVYLFFLSENSLFGALGMENCWQKDREKDRVREQRTKLLYTYISTESIMYLNYNVPFLRCIARDAYLLWYCDLLCFFLLTDSLATVHMTLFRPCLSASFNQASLTHSTLRSWHSISKA